MKFFRLKKKRIRFEKIVQEMEDEFQYWRARRGNMKGAEIACMGDFRRLMEKLHQAEDMFSIFVEKESLSSYDVKIEKIQIGQLDIKRVEDGMYFVRPISASNGISVFHRMGGKNVLLGRGKIIACTIVPQREE